MDKFFDYQKRAWAEIDLDSLAYNFSQISGNVCCVVKGNAYGHGLLAISNFCEKLGAIYFAVSNIEEAISLRKSGIIVPILVLGYTPVRCVKQLAEYRIDQTIFNYEYAVELNKQCLLNGVRIKCHLKIDTGMGRIGFRYHLRCDELNDAIKACRLSNLEVIGIFTHFSNADDDEMVTNKQFDYFTKACHFFSLNGINFRFKHCCNSAALLLDEKYKMDLIRAGIILYGIKPNKKCNFCLKPVLSLWSVVSNIKIIRQGDSVSYGRSYIAKKDTCIATIPIGYADGFWRSNQGNRVYINGNYCKIVGRVCMDQIMVECENAKIGDLVEIYGEHIPVEEVANYNHTIPYEILCAIGERVPRVYIKNKEIVDVVDKIL